MSGSCSCKPGWQGVTCSDDVNECQSSPCGDHATCSNTEGSHLCSCDTGYTKNRDGVCRGNHTGNVLKHWRSPALHVHQQQWACWEQWVIIVIFSYDPSWVSRYFWQQLFCVFVLTTLNLFLTEVCLCLFFGQQCRNLVLTAVCLYLFFWHVVSLFLTEVSVSSNNSVWFRQQCLFFWQQCLLPTAVCLCLQLVLRAFSATAAHRPVTVPVSTCSHVTTWMARAVARQAGTAVPVTTT